MRLQILSTAEDDLVDGFRFYENQEEGVGEYFLNTIYGEIDSLRLYAGMHPVVWGRYRMLSRTFPVGIFYTMNEDRIEVRAVLDLRKDPSWIKRQLQRGS